MYVYVCIYQSDDLPIFLCHDKEMIVVATASASAVYAWYLKFMLSAQSHIIKRAPLQLNVLNKESNSHLPKKRDEEITTKQNKGKSQFLF